MLCVALFVGRLPFAVVVVAAGAVLLADLAGALSAAGTRPVTLAAALPAVGLPAAAAATPGAGWVTLPDVVAVATLGAFVLVLLFGRRRGVTAALGATALAGLVIGLGATGLLLLRELPDGVTWVLGVLAVVVVVDVVRGVSAERAEPLRAAVLTVGAALVGAGILSVAANPPFGLFTAAGTAAVALLAAAAADLLREGLADAVAAARADAAAAGVDRSGGGTARPGRRARNRARNDAAAPGALTAAVLPVLLAAPVAYPLVRLAVV